MTWEYSTRRDEGGHSDATDVDVSVDDDDLPAHLEMLEGPPYKHQ